MPTLLFRRIHDLDAAAQWFLRPVGRAILESEQALIAEALRTTHAGLPWLWIGPSMACTPESTQAPADAAPTAGVSSRDVPIVGRGLRLGISSQGWSGPIRCRLPLPIASESLGAVVLQHVASLQDAGSGALLAECARALVPGGRLHVLALNPLSPYRARWQGRGLRAADAARLRQLLRDVGLAPESFAQGLGPQWSMRLSELPQAGAGLRAAFVQRAEKRAIPMTPVRARKPLSLVDPVPAAMRAASRDVVVPFRRPGER
jgi:SAM-dependent methyltransferase